MKKLTYRALSTVAGIGAAVVARKVVSALWQEALTWALATAIGAAVARVVALRGASEGWERATGDTPPGIAT